MVNLKWTLFILILIVLANNSIYCVEQNSTNEPLLNGSNHNDHGLYYFDQELLANVNNISNKYLKNNDNNNRRDYNQDSNYGIDINESDFNEAIEMANQQMIEFIETSQQFLNSTPELLTNFDPYVYQVYLRSLYNNNITRNLANIKGLNKYETEIVLPTIKIPDILCQERGICDINSEVSTTVVCDANYKYSREDGKCNNLIKTNWGSNFQCLRRLLPPDYGDGVTQPRLASDGSELPNPRVLTNTLMPDIEKYDFVRNSLHMAWGQYITHDTFKTLNFLTFGLNCCNRTLTNDECYSLLFPQDDPIRRILNGNCTFFPRSIGCDTCSLGYRNQINAATSTMDLSHLYGGNQNNTLLMRTFVGGQLKFGLALDGSDIQANLTLPRDLDRIDQSFCIPPIDRPYLGCLLTGDGARGNQQPIIMSLHVIWRRRHNIIARALCKVNPHWDDETIYQEARRILIAENQKINYEEYFPTILSKQQMDSYQLNTKYDGFTQYNPNVNPNSINSVGVGAFRFGHSQIESYFHIKRGLNSHTFRLRFNFGNMAEIWDGNTNGLIAGMEAQPSRSLDPFIVTDVREYLFFNPRANITDDLIAVNIHRGRDHGLPGYIYFVEYCTGIQVKSWRDLNQLIPGWYVNIMSSVYRDVRDIDLYMGGIAETHVNGSILGPTFGCLMAIQAYTWKHGDRFYFEHGEQSGSFTIEQLNNIRKFSSFANILCKTTDFEFTNQYPMLVLSNSNKRIPCSNMPDIDYNLWRENDKINIVKK